jgi:hypothetical protein
MPPVVAKLKGVAPYAAISLALPGGSIIALLLWLYRRLTASAHRCPPRNSGSEPACRSGDGSLDG